MKRESEMRRRHARRVMRREFRKRWTRPQRVTQSRFYGGGREARVLGRGMGYTLPRWLGGLELGL